MASDPGEDHIGRVRLSSWVWFTALFGAALEALDPHVLYAAHRTTLDAYLAVLPKALLGLAGGALVGALLGTIAKGVEHFLPVHDRPPRKRHSLAWLTGLALGVLLGGYNVMASPERARHNGMMAVCNRIGADVLAGQSALENKQPAQAAAYAEAAFAHLRGCGTDNVAVYEAQAYLVRALASYQTHQPYRADAQLARDASQRCVKRYGASDQLLAKRCQSTLDAAEQALSQHFCEESLAFDNQADDALAHQQYGLAYSEANSAVERAGRCLNQYDYAYRGLALLRRGAAGFLGGERVRAGRDIRDAKALLDRCLAEMDPDSSPVELLRNCFVQQSAARDWLSRLGG